MRRLLAMVLLVILLVVLVTVPFIIWGETRYAFFSHQEKGITDFLLATLELIGIFVSVVIVVIILYQYFRYRRPYRLVFEAFSNESELVDTEKKPLNLSILAQEELERQFKIIYTELNGYSVKKSQDFEALAADEIYIEEDFLENKIGIYVSVDQIKKSDLIEDLKDVIRFLKDPKGMNLLSLVGEIAPKEAVPVMKFIEAVIPPHVIKATGYLQWRSDIADKVGMTFKYEDLSNQRNLMVRTIWWQPSDKPATSALMQKPIASTAANDTLTNKVAEQYIELLSPTMHWMALMFWEQKLISHKLFLHRIRRVRERRRQARILYLLGALYYAYAEQYQEYNRFFCQLAVEHLRLASNKDARWNLPYLYLANLYSFKAKKKEEERHEKLFEEARSLYKQALDHTEMTNVNTLPRIIIAKALAELAYGIKTGNIDHNEELKEAMQEVEKMKKQKDPADFDPHRADCVAYLSNLAIYYWLEYKRSVNIPDVLPRDVLPRDEARRYLAYSLARSQSLRDTAEKTLDEKPDEKPKNDENILKRIIGRHLHTPGTGEKPKNDENILEGMLEGMRDDGDLKILLEILKKALDEKPDEKPKNDENILKILLEILKKALNKKPGEKPRLAELTGKDFKSEIGKILAMVDQRLGRSGN